MYDPSVRHVYDPVGHCIYCGQSGQDVRLTTEHIVPKGLGGRFELPASSCDACAFQTHAYEGKIQGGLLYTVRQKLGLLSKKRKKFHPVDVKEFIYHEASETEEVFVPLNKHPVFLLSIVLSDLPTAMFDGTDDKELSGAIRMSLLDEESIKLLQDRDGKWVGLRFTYHQTEMAQMLAKIAHSFSYAEKKFEIFRPTLNSIILGHSFPGNRLIGGEKEAEVKGQGLHEISFISQNKILVVRIRLFSRYGGSTYYVVSGKRLSQFE